MDHFCEALRALKQGERLSMRLKPIERPPSLFLYIAYWYSQHRFGKVLTTLKVIYARVPKLLAPYTKLLASQKMVLLGAPSLKFLVKSKVASINGCALCIDLALYEAKDDLLREKLSALDTYRESSLFDARERAALAFVEAATTRRVVDDATFANLVAHFSEQEIVELVWLNALENFLNLTTIPLQIGSDGLCKIGLGIPR